MPKIKIAWQEVVDCMDVLEVTDEELEAMKQSPDLARERGWGVVEEQMDPTSDEDRLNYVETESGEVLWEG